MNTNSGWCGMAVKWRVFIKWMVFLMKILQQCFIFMPFGEFKFNSISFNIFLKLLLLSIVIHSFIPLASAECEDSLPFSWASSIPLCYVLFPATLLQQLFFLPPSLHLAIYFLVYLSILLFPHSFGNSIFFHSLYMPKPT